MRFILGERELPNIRKILIGKIMQRYNENLKYFSSLRDFRECAFGIVDEGIAVALEADDWNPEFLKDDTPEALTGLKVWYIFMKCRTIADRDFRRERRYKRALSAMMVAERAPEYGGEEDLVLENLDLKRALAFLSPDQAAAISLLHFAHLSIADAAKIMKRSRAAMDMLLSRARKKLSDILENPFVFDDVQAEVVLPPPKRGRLHKEQNLEGQDDSHQDRRQYNES